MGPEIGGVETGGGAGDAIRGRSEVDAAIDLVARPDDAAVLFALHSDPDYVRFIGQAITRERFDAIFAGELDGTSSVFAFPAVDLGSDLIIGECALVPSSVREVELVVALLPSYRGSGFSYEIGRALIDACLAGSQVDMVIACVEEQNDPANHLVAKLGMVRDGIMPRIGSAPRRWEAAR